MHGFTRVVAVLACVSSGAFTFVQSVEAQSCSVSISGPSYKQVLGCSPKYTWTISNPCNRKAHVRYEMNSYGNHSKHMITMRPGETINSTCCESQTGRSNCQAKVFTTYEFFGPTYASPNGTGNSGSNNQANNQRVNKLINGFTGNTHTVNPAIRQFQNQQLKQIRRHSRGMQDTIDQLGNQIQQFDPDPSGQGRGAQIVPTRSYNYVPDDYTDSDPAYSNDYGGVSVAVQPQKSGGSGSMDSVRSQVLKLK